jgi:hypothetical protein
LGTWQNEARLHCISAYLTSSLYYTFAYFQQKTNLGANHTGKITIQNVLSTTAVVPKLNHLTNSSNEKI